VISDNNNILLCDVVATDDRRQRSFWDVLLVERFCEMELREPHSKPTHNPFVRTITKRKNGRTKKVKRNQTRDNVFKRIPASKQ
jgi:hypothetical protein